MTDQPIDPFRAAGTWLRAALHAHTTNSDGELPPWALAAHYAAAGYDVLATTDHWIRTEIPEQEARGLVVVPSVELNARLPGGRDGHLLSYGVDRVPEALMPFESLADGVRFVEQAGGVPYLAHPYWTGAPFEALDVDGLRVASRSGTRAANARSRAAAQNPTGTTRSSAVGTCSAWLLTTPTTPATTAIWPGRGFAPASARRRRCSRRSGPEPSTPRPGR